jgi:formylglycine-generating enzyme required for sulfatase activity
VTSNANWTPHIEVFNGVEMALVPAGCFMMGSDTGDPDERPVHEQCFDEPFWIDVTEVTNNAYGSRGRFSGSNRPRETITWREAEDHCASRGARLPTEREWEYAARGPDGLVYPWGNSFIPNNAVYGANSNDETADVGSRPNGASWVGAHDMSGNVREWVSSLYRPYPYEPLDGREERGGSVDYHVVRGGAWDNNSRAIRAVYRFLLYPDTANEYVGFRCARSLSEEAPIVTPTTARDT